MRVEDRLENPYEEPEGIPVDTAQARLIGAWMEQRIQPSLRTITDATPFFETVTQNAHDIALIRDSARDINVITQGLTFARRIRMTRSESATSAGAGTDVQFSFYSPTSPREPLPVGSLDITGDEYNLWAGLMSDKVNNKLGIVSGAVQLMEDSVVTQMMRGPLMQKLAELRETARVFHSDHAGVRITVSPEQKVAITAIPKESPRTSAPLVQPSEQNEIATVVEKHPIPTRAARLFGGWLSSHYSEPLQQIQSRMGDLLEAQLSGQVVPSESLSVNRDFPLLSRNAYTVSELLGYLEGSDEVTVVEATQGTMTGHTFALPETPITTTEPLDLSQDESVELDGVTANRFLLAVRHHFVHAWDGLRLAQEYVQNQPEAVALAAETIVQLASDGSRILREVTDGEGEIDGMTIRVANGVITPMVQRKASHQ